MNTRKRILFMGPSFMNYEVEIIDYLSNIYQVDYVDTEIVLKKARSRYNEINLLIRAFFKIVKPLRKRYREKLIVDFENKEKPYNRIDNKEYDLIFVINGDGISNSFYNGLLGKNQNAKTVLYLWDDRNTLFKSNHIKRFKKICSYNIKDCNSYGYEFQSMFTQQRGIKVLQHDEIKEYDISIIGSATDERVRIVKALIDKYKSKYKFFVYLYSKIKRNDIETRDVPLKFEEYMRILERSRCMLEIVRIHQTGPTTRINDCLFTQTKVITNNRYIRFYPQFDENILVLGKELDIPDEFIKEPYSKNGINATDIDQWVTSLLD